MSAGGAPDDRASLTPASAEDVADALAYGLRHSASSKRRAHDADAFIARIAAERLVEHLHRSGFVVMRRPPVKPHSTP